MFWIGGRPFTASLVRDCFSPFYPHAISHSLRFLVIDLARLIVAFVPQSLQANTGLGDRFMDALLRASDWDEHWTPPMTKPKERNILLLLRTIANALQESTENITWALKVLVLFSFHWKRGTYLEQHGHHLRKQIFLLAEPLPNELFTSPQRIVGSTLLLKYVDPSRSCCAAG